MEVVLDMKTVQQILEALEAQRFTACGWRVECDNAIRALRAAMKAPKTWTDADSDAARLALELECLLLNTKDTAAQSKWWDSAHDALELHRKRMAEPTVDGYPLWSGMPSDEAFMAALGPCGK